MDGESLPPTEYKRMLSWQLSHARDAPVVTSRKRQKKLQKRKAKAGEAASAPDHDCSSSEGEYAEQDGSGYAYLVVNSEGEEEWYYSAPESPVESGDEPWDGELHGGACTLISPAPLPPLLLLLPSLFLLPLLLPTPPLLSAPLLLHVPPPSSPFSSPTCTIFTYHNLTSCLLKD